MTYNKPTAIRWRVMGILMLASFISYTLRWNISGAAPAMIDDLGITEIQMGWVMSAFLAGYTIFQIPGGVLGDRFGPRRVLAAIAVLWGITTALTALVPGPDMASTGVIFASLLLVRFLVGVVHSPIYPATNPVIIQWFPVGGWAFPSGLSSTGLTLGVAASAPVLAWTIPTFGWRMSFIFLAPLGLLLAALWWWYARDHPEEHKSVNKEEIDFIQAGRGSALNEKSTPQIGWQRLLRNRDVLWLTLSYFCHNYVYYVIFSWFFFYLVEIRGFSMTDAGFVTAAQWVGGAVGAALGGWFCDRMVKKTGLRWGCRWPIIIGASVSALCLLGGVLQPSQAAAITMLVACFFFNQTVEGAYWTSSMAIGGKHSGAVGGTMNTGGNAVGIFNAVLVPWIAFTFGWSFAIAMAAAFAFAAVGMILLVRSDQEIAQEN